MSPEQKKARDRLRQVLWHYLEIAEANKARRLAREAAEREARQQTPA